MDDLKIKLYGTDGSFVEDINIDKNDPLSTAYLLSNGFTLTLGAGDLWKDDKFTLDVSAVPPSSFLDFQPPWQGLISEAQVILNGVYDGSNGTGTFDFVVDGEGIHGQDDLKIKVYAPGGSFLEDIAIDKNDPIDSQYALSNGIILTLGVGELINADRFQLTFTDTIGGVVDPDKPLNGTGADNPNLEPGFSVIDGSFQLNGVTINVSGSDTINEVVDRITQSSAGVSATFDTATETVLLTQQTPGAGSDIVIANDTSGFVAATKMDGATSDLGDPADADLAIAAVATFSTVQSGTITINGVDILIDVSVDFAQ